MHGARLSLSVGEPYPDFAPTALDDWEGRRCVCVCDGDVEGLPASRISRRLSEARFARTMEVPATSVLAFVLALFATRERTLREGMLLEGFE